MGRAFAGSHDDDDDDEEEDVYDEDIDERVSFETEVSEQGSGHLSEQYTPHRGMNQLGSVRSDPGGNEAIQLEY